ncbi:polysaccharide biosynthesis C-terminal domain-containing protein [Schleiferia thermophila]|uniref:polysaccharide biosynthesis C-terminal domain-containing protein n=1 Tax=Schleiferia thermophila TaxID=884107 RepID=UPI003EEEAB5A
MINIGITGSSGFIGYHLYQTIKLNKEFNIVEFNREFFENSDQLEQFVSSCDVIVHLAGLNRHHSDHEIYNVNLGLVQKLINALEKTNSKPHVLISSSLQEERGNVYGNSKKESRMLLSEWAKNNNARFSGLIIPNVFGPFGKPFYNSVVATFCHQISRYDQPILENDVPLKLIYVGELVNEIIELINNKDNTHYKIIPHTAEVRVSGILNLLLYFRESYQENGIIPKIKNSFELQLFNTYRCYMNLDNYFPRKYNVKLDERGIFVELSRSEISGQTSFSTTKPGITRGNHFHTRKIERFSVIKGKARIQLRRIGTDKVYQFFLDGNNPGYVDMPIWYTHNITNIGDDELLTIFWINEHYNPDDPDTFFEKV